MPNHASTSLCHPTETRALSIREYARIQEFPDDWKFSRTVSDQCAQVGNAVPTRLKVAGEVISEYYSSNFRRSKSASRNTGEPQSSTFNHIFAPGSGLRTGRLSSGRMAKKTNQHSTKPQKQLLPKIPLSLWLEHIQICRSIKTTISRKRL